jgi:hypothetical protein
MCGMSVKNRDFHPGPIVETGRRIAWAKLRDDGVRVWSEMDGSLAINRTLEFAS